MAIDPPPKTHVMEQTRVQQLLDRMAISASVLCLIHCLGMPLLLVALPLLSSTFMAGEDFHRFLVVFVLPISVIALFIGCRRHKDRGVLVLGSLGLLGLVSTALFGHDLLGETGERAATVVSGVTSALGHLRNDRLCRQDGCDD